ncbi:uncharacterized protein LOC123524929 isoform X1 [Mercenaria mercenaria]|uniref:uncharacterized protein LOC123524929 isoform X1 n=1 Tax=Mercenaria mercenaria TaxID=6596 RepID=UPI00234E90FE|nr:uncharacterized protein LOC123524929 isoform X1 [Mercenaria mercenaria]
MCIIILLLPCVFGVVVSARTCFEMSPKDDVFIMAGSELQVNCSLKMLENGSDCVDDYNIYNITIRKGSKEFSSDLFEYFAGKKTLTLTIRNVTFEDDGFYNCVYGGNIQSTMRMHIGEPPGAPENLSCISRNFNDLSCSFALSEKIVNIPTGNKIKFKMNRQKWTNITESNYHCNKSMCTFWLNSRNDAPSAYTFTPSAQYKIRAIAWNKLGKKSTDLEIGNTGSIVKPDPVDNIGFDFTKFSRRVRLRWSCPKDLTFSDSSFIAMDYKIAVTSEWQNRTLLVENKTTAVMEHYIENLIPFTSYTVTVQAKPSAAVLDIYWSNTSVVTFVTLSTVSEHAVSVTAGSYMMVDPGRPLLYWKNPARRYWYGNITGYKTMLEKVVLSENTVDELGRIDKGYNWKNPIHIYGSEPLSENIEGMAVSAVLNNKSLKENSYQVEMMLTNTEGVSSNRSKMIVPNWNIGQALRPEWVSVEIADSSVYISWYMDPEYCAVVTSVTYYWCIVDSIHPFTNSNVSCKEQFDWKTVNISDGCGSRISHEIQNSADPHDIKYSVSVQTSSQLSGGMMWEKFRFSKYNVPEKPLYAVSTDGTNLKVHILYGDYYTSKGGSPDNYSVEYRECLQNDDCLTGISNGTIHLFPANFINPVYMIGNMKSGSQYRVRVSSFNSVGRSEYGEQFKITFANDETVSVAGALGGTAGGIVCVFLLLVLIWYGRKKYNDIQIEASIKMPDDLPVDEMTKMVEDRISMVSDDHDSGKGTDSLRSSLDDATCPEARSLGLNSYCIGNGICGPTNQRTSTAQNVFLNGNLCETVCEKIAFDGECEIYTDKTTEEMSNERRKSNQQRLPTSSFGDSAHKLSSDKSESSPDTFIADRSKLHLTELCSGFVTETPVEGKSSLDRELNGQGYVLHGTEMNIPITLEKVFCNTDYVAAVADTERYDRKGELLPIKGETYGHEHLLNDSTCGSSRLSTYQKSEKESFDVDSDYVKALNNGDNCQRKEGYVLNSDAELLQKMLDNRMVNASIGMKDEDCYQNTGSISYVPEAFNSVIENATCRTQVVNTVDTENPYVLERDHFPLEQVYQRPSKMGQCSWKPKA